jgi:double-strand break repair protein MRE11
MSSNDDASPPPSDGDDDEERFLEDADEDTFRIMLSTDNHLGYAERDPVRGMDSFAAFEEVLYLAKEYKVRAFRLCFDISEKSESLLAKC